MKTINEKKYTARELAVQFGCAVKTVHNHANKLFGKAQNGVVRTFDEAQVTILLESVKASGFNSRGNQHRANEEVETLKAGLQGTETELTLDLQIALAERAEKEAAQKSRDLWKRKAEQNEARAVKVEAELGRLAVEYKDVLKANTQLFDIAVSSGTLTSDREDMLALYRR
jgi:flagellar motor switch/type III secretory pathway protein FliN